jgi:hypothetical protein
MHGLPAHREPSLPPRGSDHVAHQSNLLIMRELAPLGF